MKDSIPMFVLRTQEPDDLRLSAYAGLMSPQAEVSPAFFYDALGSHLFGAITLLDEYPATREELEIFSVAHEAIAKQLPTGCSLIDLGAADCAKAARLFGSILPTGYLAVDVSEAYLREALESLSERPGVPAIAGLVVDFSRGLPPNCLEGRVPGNGPRVFFYPGSSIGNFNPAQATDFLRGLIREHQAAALIIGIDLIKPARLLEAAYDDALGVTAAFNLNVLRVLNRSVQTDFEPADWRHRARFNQEASRVEMHLEARRDLEIRWPGGGRRFQAGQTLHTENAYKYTEASFEALLNEAGFAVATCYRSRSGGFVEFVAHPATAA